MWGPHRLAERSAGSLGHLQKWHHIGPILGTSGEARVRRRHRRDQTAESSSLAAFARLCNGALEGSLKRASSNDLLAHGVPRS